MGLHVVVLAGGSGTRLWPLSTASLPKHLLPIASGGRTLLRATLDRLAPLRAGVWVVTTAVQAEGCAAELAAAGLDPQAVIAEPAARGTGPALGLAVAWIAAGDPEALVCSVHADHHVGDDEAYRRAVAEAAGWALASGGLATVGLVPAEPSTGFGYVELGERLAPERWVPPPGDERTRPELAAHRAAGFREKPPPDTAREYVEGGRHLWNTGLFAWTATTFLAELDAASPETAAGVAATVTARRAGDEPAAAAAYTALDVAPVDTLVLERTGQLSVVTAAFPWSDLGSWSDLARARREAGEADERGNVVDGDAVLAGEVRGCLVHAAGGRPVAVVGATDLIVVDVGTAVLVVPAGEAQAVRDVARRVEERGPLG